MTAIAIFAEQSESGGRHYRALAGETQTEGRTAGEALDALTARLGERVDSTLVIVQHFRPERFFTVEQRQRLEELMGRWRGVRNVGGVLPREEQAELNALAQAELEAATRRAQALAGELP